MVRFLLASLSAAALSVFSADLQPSFPNHALVLQPTAANRDNPVTPADPGLPFSWPHLYVVRQGDEQIRVLGGFDPDFQRVQFALLPTVPVNLKVDGVDAANGAFAYTIFGKTAGNTEDLFFQVQARNLLNPEVYPITFDIRGENQRIRGAPFLARSPGEFIRPGQIVRYTWTRTGVSERKPKVETSFVGKTGPATGLKASKITEVLALKVQPFVLGHYLMTVTPRDIVGEPARGSQSNGQVFRCAFGNENLPPGTDGMIADTFTPAVGQTITIRPFAIDPETGQDTFDNQTFDFGDGTVVTGVSGATTHAYSKPGIYRVRCTVVDAQGLSATAEDNVIVGATLIPKLQFSVRKSITPEEAGVGELENDQLKVSFRGTGAKGGDRIVFAYNRNRFGSMFDSDVGDDIVLGPGGGFEKPVERARRITVGARGGNIGIEINAGSFDRTGDARLGRADQKGVFKNQRVAVCVVPADGSDPRVFMYSGNVQVRVNGGFAGRINFAPEEFVKITATQKEPDPKKQEIE